MLAKVLDKKVIPDTVKVRHILIATNENRDTTAALHLADSLQTLLTKGANFDTLVAKFSDDGGSKEKHGVYDSVGWGRMVGPFNEFMFLKPVGAKGIVKTEFGYHIMENLAARGADMAYKIAYLPSPIYASDATIQEANEKASVFASESRDGSAFDKNFEEKLKAQGYQKGVAKDIKENDAMIQVMGYSRPLVKNIFKAKLGQVLTPEMVGENYVVAVVSEINEKGTQTLAKVRDQLTAMVRNKKKAEMLKKQIGTVTTIDDAAAKWGAKPIEALDSIRMNSRGGGPNSLGFEPRLRGAAFNPNNKGKVVPEVLIGNSGAYVIRVDNVSSTPVTSGSIADQRTAMRMQLIQQSSSQQSPYFPATILKEAATIKDKRSSIY
jgi:peptidyl-prolyl cis-trans isomerase D